MMNTDIMRELVAEAELGTRDMPTATAAAALWGFDDASLRDLRYSSNAIYIFKQQDIPRFMRLSWSGDCSKELLQAELDYLTFLTQHEYPNVLPIPSLQGNHIEEIRNAYGLFYAVTFSAAKGKHLPIETLQDDQIKAWGMLLGRLHKLSATYERPTNYHRPSWNEVLDMHSLWIPPTETNTQRYLEQARDWLSQMPTSRTHYGLIHWDFEPDNLTWQDGRIEVIDFDDAAYFWYAADIAFALDDVLDEPPERARHIIRHFLDGYASLRELENEWIDRLPRFVRLMRVLKAARVYHAYANTHPELDPTWLSDLRKRHSIYVNELEEKFNEPFQAPLTSEEVMIWGELS